MLSSMKEFNKFNVSINFFCLIGERGISVQHTPEYLVVTVSNGSYTWSAGVVQEPLRLGLMAIYEHQMECQ